MSIPALLIAALLQTASAARVGSVTGSVELIRKNETAVARIGDLVVAGDQIRTLASSYAMLSTASESILQLMPDSRFEVKNIEGESWLILTEGSLRIANSTRLRVETKFGQFITSNEPTDFELNYTADGIQVSVTRGSFKTEVLDLPKVVFKGTVAGERTYEAGARPSAAGHSDQPPVIIIPEVFTPVVGPPFRTVNPQPKPSPK